ncbi:DNA-binding protein [uncultured Tateyamaria sp.]|uniref:DNA-binding protein n=1 Tax=uncultured Tateyamaria sp. TaxID=455651 RepID=UPI002611C223|nr:DNA-binding protein [uncultured Tateyamaria sp.]
MTNRSEFYSAGELAQLAAERSIKGLPRTKRGINNMIARLGWNDEPETVARPRTGRVGGGGMEYHVTLLPKAVRAALLMEPSEPTTEVETRRAEPEAFQEFFTAREIAEVVASVGLTGFPATKRGVNIWAERNGWKALPVNLSRKRKCRVGGGYEYHFTLLPDAVQAAVRHQHTSRVLMAKQASDVAHTKHQVQTRDVMQLQARQRMVMEKRSQILLAVDAHCVAHGTSQAGAIRALVAAQDQHARWVAAQDAVKSGAPIHEAEAQLLLTEPDLTRAEGFDLQPEVLALANDRDNGSAKISRTTLYRWFQLRKEGGVQALAPERTKVDAPLPEGFSEFLRFYGTGAKQDATEALADYLKSEAGKKHPLTIAQVRYALSVKLNNIEKHVGREGMLTLRSRLPYIQRTTDNMLPTTMYVADGKTFDAEIADWKSHRPMKPELTSILDVATRYCVGFAVSRKENTIAVVEALRKACIGHGIPAIFYTDRGAGYKNKTLDGDVSGLMGRLSITKMHALPYNSQAKGIIERFNRTAWNPLAKKLPTYLGKDMDKEASARVHKATRADIAEFGQSRLLLSWEDFQAKCQEAVDAYNNAPHGGLPKIADPETGRKRHMSPAEAWAVHVEQGFKPVEVEADERDDLFRPYVIRVVRRALVEWNNNKYFHNDLTAYHQRQVMVGYDDDDAERVWVREFDPDIDAPGRLICVATYSGNKVDYVPRTAQRAAEENRAKGRLRRLQRKVDDVAQELNGPVFLEDNVASIQPFVDTTPAPEPVHVEPLEQLPPLEISNPPEAAPVQPPRRRTFGSDEELAIWAMANPEEVTAGQISLLEEQFAFPISRRLFEAAGVDLGELQQFLAKAKERHNKNERRA